MISCCKSCTGYLIQQSVLSRMNRNLSSRTDFNRDICGQVIKSITDWKNKCFRDSKVFINDSPIMSECYDM